MIVFGEHLPESAVRVSFVRRFLQRRRRLFHQLSHLDDYELFVLSTDMQTRQWPRRGAPSELSVDPLASMRAAHFQPEEKLDEGVEAWDEGVEEEAIPFIDLSEEE